MHCVLLVDDEVASLYSLKCSVNWDKLGVANVLTADGGEKAIQLMQRYTVHLLVCDIEMPGMDGLQLLSWVKEHRAETEVIFLTCHADFDYAQRAMELGGLNYLLKPVPPKKLAQAVAKGLARIEQQTAVRKDSALWHESRSARRRSYLHSVITRAIAPRMDALMRLARQQEVEFHETTLFCPVLLTVQRWNSDFSEEDKSLMEYGIRNTANEVLVREEDAGEVLEVTAGKLLVILFGSDGEKMRTALTGACAEQIDLCGKYLACDVSCFIGRAGRLDALAAHTAELKEYCQMHAIHHKKVYLLGSASSSVVRQPETPDSSSWAGLLREGCGEEIGSCITVWLQKVAREGGADTMVLQGIQQDLLQTVYTVLQQNSIQANLLFQDKHSFIMQEKSLYSIEHFQAWVQWILHKATACLQELTRGETVVARVKKYVAANIKNEEMNRENIANAVFLNPDYLSRLFKQQTGMTLSEYVLQQRLSLAKSLLTTTSLPIGDISLNLGYSSFSYFTRVFKNATGRTPVEYRKENGR